MPYATDYTTLLTGSYWGGAEVTNKPVFVTYSFDATAPASDQGHLAASALATFRAFTADQQTQATNALKAWSSASTAPGGGSGIIFLQVAPGQGDINFASYDFSSDPAAKNSGGQAYYPWGNWNYSTFGTNTGHFGADNPGSGNVLMNTASATGGLFSYATLLHEIGHALGLKHPTEAWTDDVPGYINVPHNQWDPNVTYDPNFSIMSAGGDGTSTLTDLTSVDIQAIQSIYGTPAMAANEDKSWSWNNATYTLTQTLKDDGETVRGVSTSNVITGGAGDDAIYAIGAGTNMVSGGGGADTLVGGSGTSTLDGGAGADTINGWFGVSYASYGSATAGVTANLANRFVNTGDAAGDVYLHITRLKGSAYGDTLVAEGSGDVIYGLGGGDTVTGGAGNDNLYGGLGNDTLTGGGGTDYLDGGAGADVIDGTGGIGYAGYGDATAGVTVNLLNTAANTGDAAGDSYIAIHNVQGSNYDDILVGDNAGDRLYGLGGKDRLTGGGGADTLYGGAGDDTLTGGGATDYLDGGAGADVIDGTGSNSFAVYFDATAGVTVNLLNMTLNTGDAAGDSYVAIHSVQGSNFADTIVGDNAGGRLYGLGGADILTGGTGSDLLYGGLGNDSLTGGSGNDYLDGGAGADILDGTGSGVSYAGYGDATAGVTVNLLSVAANTGDAAGDTYINLHNVQGSAYADAITADNAGDRLYGLGGSDTLTGGAGSDFLYGGAGNDTLTGGAGTDYLDGGAGADVLDGTGGKSYAMYGDATAGVTVNLINTGANTGDAAGDSYVNLHNVQGSAYADTIVGDNAGGLLYGLGGNDTLTGGTGTNALYGGFGDDRLTGGSGLNYLDGGAGADILDGTGGTAFAMYGDATAAVTVNLLNTAANTGDAAGDSYINIHKAQGSAYGDTMVADNAGDVLYGLAGNDTLTGGTGNDYLAGGLGTDTLTGGSGADRFALNAPTDGLKTVTDFSSAEADLMQVSASGFGGGLAAGSYLDSSRFVTGTAATAATGQFLWNAASHVLSWDQDGTGGGTAIAVASFTNNATLSAHDILLG